MNEVQRIAALARVIRACSHARHQFAHDQVEAGIRWVAEAGDHLEGMVDANADDSPEYRRAVELFREANASWAGAL